MTENVFTFISSSASSCCVWEKLQVNWYHGLSNLSITVGPVIIKLDKLSNPNELELYKETNIYVFLQCKMFYSTDIWISIRLYLVYNKRCWYQATILITFQNKKSVDENEMAGQQATNTRSHCGFIIIII